MIHCLEREISSNSSGLPAAHKAKPVALTRPFRWMVDIADCAVRVSRVTTGRWPEQHVRAVREIDYIERLAFYCADCKTPMSSAFQRTAVAEAKMKDLASSDFLTMSMIEAEGGGAMPTHDGRCPRCKGENALYVWAA